MKKIKALTFDTGGTILDWHSGFKDALKKAGDKYNYSKPWNTLANELRRRSLKAMLNLGENHPPKYNFDNAHEFTLKEIIRENGLENFSQEDVHNIAYKAPHNFTCWKDFPEALPRLKENFIVCSFTILSYRLIIDTAKRNNLSWDCVFSCEGIGKYKLLPESYRTVAHMLQLDVEECLMVACHNFDLDAARKVGFKTAFVRRPDEWGEEGPPDPNPGPDHDIIVDNFSELSDKLNLIY
jgi:2-haloacid dehalogenase